VERFGPLKGIMSTQINIGGTEYTIEGYDLPDEQIERRTPGYVEPEPLYSLAVEFTPGDNIFPVGSRHTLAPGKGDCPDGGKFIIVSIEADVRDGGRRIVEYLVRMDK
jgi:hypothetical protein